jgi:hypothetical protein
MPFNGVNFIGTFGDTKSPIEIFIFIPKRNYINKQTHFLINNNNIIEKKKKKKDKAPKSRQNNQLPKGFYNIKNKSGLPYSPCQIRISTITQAKRDFKKKIFKKAH